MNTKLLSSKQTKERRDYNFSLENYCDCNALKVSIFYLKGGCNWYSGKEEKRGYWVSFQPCSINENSVRCIPTDGVKQFLLEVTRQSQKRFNEAVKMISKEMLENVIEYKQFSLNDEDIAFILETIKEG